MFESPHPELVHTDEAISEDAAKKAAPDGQWWDRSAFCDGSGQNGEPCPQVIDTTGRPRCLFHGPGLHLEPGLWRATVFLHVCDMSARRPFTLQFGIGPDYTSVDLEYGVQGNHRVELRHGFPEGGPGQIRLWLRRAAFHGEVRLVGARISRLGDIENAGGQ
jgi:hypothetical protein